MIRKLLPIVLLLVGLGAGVGAGLALRPVPTAESTNHASAPNPDETHAKAKDDHGNDEHGQDRTDGTTSAYVKLNNQFVVPVVNDALIESLVVMSLSLEVDSELTNVVYEREPKLRDGLLQVLFDHANMGGFEGEFTNSNNMDILRTALTEVARGIVGKGVTGILITGLARQDV
jgi:flagellar basal body-associated protein FliL